MSNQRIVGIDLGTTNSLVAFMQGDVPVVIPGDDGLNLVPSVVALDENDQIIVGNAARKYLIETPERAVYSIKRLMGRGIEDINLHIRRGSFVVVTVRIGSGKTTLLQTLLGLLPKDSPMSNLFDSLPHASVFALPSTGRRSI